MGICLPADDKNHACQGLHQLNQTGPDFPEILSCYSFVADENHQLWKIQHLSQELCVLHGLQIYDSGRSTPRISPASKSYDLVHLHLKRFPAAQVAEYTHTDNLQLDIGTNKVPCTWQGELQRCCEVRGAGRDGFPVADTVSEGKSAGFKAPERCHDAEVDSCCCRDSPEAQVDRSTIEALSVSWSSTFAVQPL